MSLLRRLRIGLKRMAFDGAGRDRRQEPERIVATLGLQPGDRVADLGSGTGYFTVRLAEAVGPTGLVYAVDTDEELLDEVLRRTREAGHSNVVPVTVSSDPPSLPEPVDLIFLSHTYHHLSDRSRYFARLALFLRPGGRVAVVEGRPTGFISRRWGHVTEPDAVRREMTDAGYRLVGDHPGGRDDSFQVFEIATNPRG